MNHLEDTIQDFEKVSREQAEKGMTKYGQPLNPMDSYSWIRMAKEEAIDQYQYLHALEKKLSFALDKIRRSSDREEINFWCDEMEGKNNGD